MVIVWYVMTGVKRKDTYAELPDQQRAIIDAKASAPNTPNTEIAEELDTNRSYVSQVVNAQSHILEAVVRVVRTGEAEPDGPARGFTPPGVTETATDSQTRGLTAGPTVLDARTRGASAVADEIADATEGEEIEILIRLTRDDLAAFLGGEVPERFVENLLVALADEAFSG